MDQPGKVVNPARVQLKRKKYIFSLYPFAPEKLVSRDRFGGPVSRQPAHSPHLIKRFLSLSAAAPIYLLIPPTAIAVRKDGSRSSQTGMFLLTMRPFVDTVL